MPSTGKYSQIPKSPFYENFRYCETKNIRLKISHAQNFLAPGFFRNTEGLTYETLRYYQTKNFRRKIVMPLFRIVLWYHKHSETPKGYLTNFTSKTKSSQHLFVTLASMVHQKFRTRQVGSARNNKLLEIPKRLLY